MINSLKVATSGYLKRTTKAVLVIAVAGYLNFGGSPPPPIVYGGDGYVRHETQYDEQKEISFIRNVKQQEQDIIDVIKTFVQCQ